MGKDVFKPQEEMVFDISSIMSVKIIRPSIFQCWQLLEDFVLQEDRCGQSLRPIGNESTESVLGNVE